MDRRREEYLDAHRQMEAVNKLEDKSRTAYRIAYNREEQAQFDDRSPLARKALNGI